MWSGIANQYSDLSIKCFVHTLVLREHIVEPGAGHKGVELVVVHMEVLQGQVDHTEQLEAEVVRTRVVPRHMLAEDHDHKATVLEVDHTTRVVEEVGCTIVDLAVDHIQLDSREPVRTEVG